MSTNLPDTSPTEGLQRVISTVTRSVRPVDERLPIAGIRMTYVALSFFVATWFFALMYLQILNSNGQWLPRSVHRPLGYGIAEVVAMLASGIVYFWGQWSGIRGGKQGNVRIGLVVASVLGVVALVLHVVTFFHLGFGTTDGGYASVFIGTEGMFTALLGIMIIVLLGVTNRALLGLTGQSPVAVEAFGELWGWMCGVALLVFLGLYVQPFFPIA